MWPFNKKNKEKGWRLEDFLVKKHLEYMKPIKLINDNTVKCETCKHLIKKEDAQYVENVSCYGDEYYCPEHKVPYDQVGFSGYIDTNGNYCTKKSYWKKIPAQRVEVTEKGKKVRRK